MTPSWPQTHCYEVSSKYSLQLTSYDAHKNCLRQMDGQRHNTSVFSKWAYKNMIWLLSTNHKVSQTNPKYSNELPCGLCVHFLIVLEFKDTSTLVGHFVSSPREREKRDRKDSRGDQREGHGRRRNRKESKETKEIKIFPLYPYLLQG